MKKKSCIFVFSFFLFVFFCLTLDVNAANEYVLFLDTNNIRSGPSTSYTRLGLENVGSIYYLKSTSLVADEKMDGSCDSGWYQIDYNGSTGYVCSEYVRLGNVTYDDSREPTTTCEAEMQAAGFPSSYWSGLCSLKEEHPNWTFRAVQTNLEWSVAVEKESACGKSLIQSNNSSYIDSSCSSREGSFRAASQTAVAFYMDPRNFLTEQYIFQFEYLKYDSALESSYTTAIDSMLKSASFYQYHLGLGTNFSQLVTDAGKEMDINPVSLASRMRQEMGTGTSLYNLYSGVYTGLDGQYYGYYNFYNIGVNSSCVNNITKCGLSYAKNHGWNTVYNGIKGGADLLSNNYLNNGQFNTYLQKFNVAPVNTNTLYLNQYMTNIAAPSSEATSTYNSYKNLGLLDSAFAFYIPVYYNMSASIDNSPSGGVDSGGSSSSPSSSAIGTIVTSAGYKMSGSQMSGVAPSSDVNTVKSNLEAIVGSGNVTIKNASGTTVSSGKVGTGYQITITNSTETKTLTVVVYGDTSGDGEVNALDLLQVQKSILGTYNLSGAYGEAGDTSSDGVINALDLLQVQKSILGTYTISQ